MDRGSIAGNCRNISSWARLTFLNRKTSFSMGSHRLEAAFLFAKRKAPGHQKRKQCGLRPHKTLCPMPDNPAKDTSFSSLWREFNGAKAPELISLGAPYYAGIAKRSNVLASGASGLVPSEVRNTLPFFLCGKKGPVAPQRKTRRDLRSRKVPQCRKSSSPH